MREEKQGFCENMYWTLIDSKKDFPRAGGTQRWARRSPISDSSLSTNWSRLSSAEFSVVVHIKSGCWNHVNQNDVMMGHSSSWTSGRRKLYPTQAYTSTFSTVAILMRCDANSLHYGPSRAMIPHVCNSCSRHWGGFWLEHGEKLSENVYTFFTWLGDQ